MCAPKYRYPQRSEVGGYSVSAGAYKGWHRVRKYMCLQKTHGSLSLECRCPSGCNGTVNEKTYRGQVGAVSMWVQGLCEVRRCQYVRECRFTQTPQKAVGICVAFCRVENSSGHVNAGIYR